MSIAIIVDAVGAMKASADYGGDMDQTDGFALSPEDIKAGIVYILHYGRVLFKGEDETEPEPEPEVRKPGMTAIFFSYFFSHLLFLPNFCFFSVIN